MEDYNLSNIPARVISTLDKCMIKATSSCMNSKHCACLEKNGRIYVYSINDYSGINYSKINKFSYHAEESLLKNFTKKGRSKYNLYIVRINTKGKLQNSKPCSDCIKIIKQFSNIISKVIYPDNNEIKIVKPKTIKSKHLSIGNRMKKRNNNKKY